MTELLAEFSSSAYLTDTPLSRLKRIPVHALGSIKGGRVLQERFHARPPLYFQFSTLFQYCTHFESVFRIHVK
jgi:hypothetical protein